MYNSHVIVKMLFQSCLIFAQAALVYSSLQVDLLYVPFQLQWIQTLEGAQVTIRARLLMEIPDVLCKV